jgi:protein SCO1/2
MSARSRMLAGFVCANLAIAAVAAIVLFNRPATPPLIQGVLLPEGRELQAFSLVDHHNNVFTRAELKGRWHLVSYGFTTCPDICPTTLSQLAIVADELDKQGRDDLVFVFYSVDHRRDTVSQMASYVPFFHTDFIGLTHLDDPENPHLPFEKSLGIAAQLVPNTEPGAEPDANDYSVNHGVTLFLINPQGELQAIFQPDTSTPGSHSFDPEIILRDYLAIREYLG